MHSLLLLTKDVIFQVPALSSLQCRQINLELQAKYFFPKSAFGCGLLSRQQK